MLFAGRRAHGVEFYWRGEKRQILAHKEVILSAGTLGSPKLLMLSGVGPKQHLEEVGVRRTNSHGSDIQIYVTVANMNFLNDNLSSIQWQSFWHKHVFTMQFYGLKIPVVADLSVGDNLQNHIQIDGVHFLVKDPVATTPVMAGSFRNKVKYWLTGGGKLTNLTNH